MNCLPCMQRRSCESTGMMDMRPVSGRRPVEPGPKFALKNCFLSPSWCHSLFCFSSFKIPLKSQLCPEPWDTLKSQGKCFSHSCAVFFFAFKPCTGVFLVSLTKFLILKEPSLCQTFYFVIATVHGTYYVFREYKWD